MRDLDGLVDAVCERSPLHTSYIHGEQHWRAVAEAGLRLAADTPRADGAVVYLFSLFHDAMRVNEDDDPDHGARAAELVAELHGELFYLSPDRLDLLIEACRDHSDARYSDDPTIGACFDADRLNLWRVGKVPELKLLSTDAAGEDAVQHWSKSVHGRARSWAELIKQYSA